MNESVLRKNVVLSNTFVFFCTSMPQSGVIDSC